jgi:hypothetical protein
MYLSIPVAKALASLSLISATALVIFCPCQPLIECHKPHFYLLIISAVVLVSSTK